MNGDIGVAVSPVLVQSIFIITTECEVVVVVVVVVAIAIAIAIAVVVVVSNLSRSNEPLLPVPKR